MTRRIVIHNEYARSPEGKTTRVPVRSLRTGDTLGSGERVVSAKHGAASPQAHSQIVIAKGGYQRMVYWAGDAKVTVARDGVGSAEEVAYGEGWHSNVNENPYSEAAEKAAWERGRSARKLKMKFNSNARAGEVRGKAFQPPKQRDVQRKETIPGTRSMAERAVRAEEEFLDQLQRAGDLTRAQAITAFKKLKEVKALKFDAYVGGRITVKHGAFWDRAVVRRAAGLEDTHDYKSEKGYVAKLLNAETGGVLKQSEPHISNGPGLKKWIQDNARELIQRGKRVKAEVVVVFYDPNLV
jgi:hypothetical protein